MLSHLVSFLLFPASTFHLSFLLLESPSPDGTYTYVSATITTAASHTIAILQAGVDIQVIDSVVYTDAWYVWYPNFVLYYDEFDVNPGDLSVASVNVTGNDRGICTVQNLTSGESISKTVSSPKSTVTLAEWVMEDYTTAGDMVPLVGFGNVTFEDCMAQSSAGGMYGLANATIYELVVDETVAAGVEVLGINNIVVKREEL
ncbi:peptidase A4 family-domain-containing protein [Aspergillus cavernicola]|uniref:Peptidase A4 family-domain-containing protein n=1 Tax=Aspergillus cavernicola TaxID=176166 RepID=A0ABR4I7H8_9EURO